MYGAYETRRLWADKLGEQLIKLSPKFLANRPREVMGFIIQLNQGNAQNQPPNVVGQGQYVKWKQRKCDHVEWKYVHVLKSKALAPNGANG